MSELEDLRNLVAFYQSEGEGHPAEDEYRRLASIPPDDRTDEEVSKLVRIARALSQAADDAEDAFKATLDKVEL